MTAQEHVAPVRAPVPLACDRLVADLGRRWDHAATYLLLDGRLRCTAASGPLPVADGLVPGTDAAGRAVTTGVTAHDADHDGDSGLVRVCAPVLVGGACVGLVEIRCPAPVTDDGAADAEQAARELAEVVRVSGSAVAPVGQRLARLAVDVACAPDAERLVRVVLEGATALTGRSTAVLALLPTGGPWQLHSATGPLAQAVSGWDADDVAALAAHVPAPASVHLTSAAGGPAALAFLGAAGVTSAAVHPLVVGGTVTGLLLVADAEPQPQDPVASAAVEVLAALAAAGLRSAGLLADLADRALEALTGLRTADDFRDDLTEFCIDAIRSGAVTHTSMRLRPEQVATGAPDDRTTGLLVEALNGQLRHGDRLYRLDGADLAVLLATGEPDSAAAVAARLVRGAREAGVPVVLGWALVDGPPAVVRAATDRALADAAPA
jgi:hypothetical protein